MNFIATTLNGVTCQDQPGGTLVIQRRVIQPESVIVLEHARPKSFEMAAILPKGTWDGAFFFPSGEKDDKDSFFTWVVFVREDMLKHVQAACQSRELFPEGEDAKAREERLAIAEAYRLAKS